MTFQVWVKNDSVAEEFKLTSLWDDIYGDITDDDYVDGEKKIIKTNCAVPQIIPFGGGIHFWGNYSQKFVT